MISPLRPCETHLLLDTGDRTAFSHILVREVLYQDLPAARRAQIGCCLADPLTDSSPSALAIERAKHAIAEAIGLARRIWGRVR